MRFITWNIMRLYRAGSLTAAARELGRHKLYLVGVQDARWEKGGRVSRGIKILSTEKETKNII